MAVDITGIRKDGMNYPEGIKIGDAMSIAFFEKSWLIPGVTYTKLDFGDNGTLIEQLIDTDTYGTVTDLCEDGTTPDVKTKSWQVSINKKVSAEFDGCFTVAGIADKKVQKVINSMKFRMMAETYRHYVETQMKLTGTASTVSMGTGDSLYINYLADRILEYKKLNKVAPTLALVSSDYLAGLEKDIEMRQTNLGDQVLINGVVGRAKGVTFIEVLDQTEDLILFTMDAIGIGEPSSPKQIPNEGILGAYEIASANGDQAGFSNGMISLYNIQAQKGIVNTWVHKFFGIGIKDAKLITIPKAAAKKA